MSSRRRRIPGQPTRSRPVLAIAAAVVAATVGCGSTAQPESFSVADAGGQGAGVPDDAPGSAAELGELSATDDASRDAAAAAVDVPTTAQAASAPPRAASAAAVTGSGERSARQAPSVTPDGPGVTATTVKIGIIYQSQSRSNVGAQFGAKNLVYGDLLAMQKAVIDYINSHGGVAGGRKLVPVAFEATTASEQAICAAWTEDDQVFAGIYPGGRVPAETLTACMAGRRSIYVATPFVPGDDDFFATFAPYYYTPRSLESVRMGGLYVHGLHERGFFGSRSKVGLLYYDVPSLRSALARGVQPALRDRRLALHDTYAVHYPQSNAEIGDTSAAIQNAVLKFSSEGVDRVMFLDAGAGLAFGFMTYAQSQGYQPRYGLMSGSNPNFIAQNFDQSQLAGAVGVGWVPPGDVDAEGIPASPARTLCREIMDSAGQAPQSMNDLLAQYDICSTLFFLREGLASADRSAPVNATTFAASVAKLADLPAASASSLGDGYGRGKAWGTGSYSAVEYLVQCGCFRYTGSRRPV